jgi:hypothetical protein
VKRIKKLSLVITMGLIFTFATMSVTSVMAQTTYGTQWNNLLAGSPHYYGEGGHPKFGTQWYYDHLTEVGRIRTQTDGTLLYINIFSPVGGTLLCLEETHVAVVMDFDDFPQTKKGNPKVGQFPYKHENLNGQAWDSYVIPLASLGVGAGDTVLIAVHAVLCCGETAWANCGGSGAFFAGNNWATYYPYTIPQPPD